MHLFYSPSTRSFFDEQVHGSRSIEWEEEVEGASEPSKHSQLNSACLIPADALPISSELFDEVMQAQSAGMLIVPDAEGMPMAIEQVASVEEQLAAIRRRRDRALRETDWTQLPDALSSARRKLWKDHREALRDFPRLVEAAISAGKPVDTVPFPEAPS